FYMLPYLEHYGFTPDRISFLRSEDCLNDDHTITATEFWAVPKGATPPSSSESIKSCQAQSELVGLESPIKSESVFKATLRQFITKLQARPKAVGIVGGYYYRSPSRVIRQKLREPQICLEQNGIS